MNMDFGFLLHLISFGVIVFIYFFYKNKISSLSNTYEETLDKLSKDQDSTEKYYSSAMLALKESAASEQRLINEKKEELKEKEENFLIKLSEMEAKFLKESEDRKKVLSQKKSSEVRLGHIAETLAPFLDQFDFDPETCTFLGKPIDYISFNNDGITFIEVKSGDSQLSQKQKHIKQLIEDKKVFWKEVRIK